MKKISLMICLFIPFLGMTQQESILQKIDRNMTSKNRVMEGTMTINGKRNSRTITSRTWSEGAKKSLTEYLSPAAEKGTKMLKLEGKLWIYSPSTDRTIQISGNMLRQSVMGSDLSYEDMMDDRKLDEVYAEKLIGHEKIGDHDTFVLELIALVEDVAYHSQKIWVDTERFVPLKQEMYAKSGKLLKTLEYSDVRKVEGRWFPFVFVYKDMMKEGKGTEFTVQKIQFDQPIPDYLFSKASLK